jgi:hypothetical protein
VEIQDADKSELEPEPKEFNDDPEEKIPFEHRLARDGVFPERGVNGEITL